TRKNAWKSPKGARIKVAAAAPIIGWTDLVDALLPNGLIHNDNMPPTSLDDRMAEPTGVLKQSFVDAFFFLMGNTTSEQFVRPGYLSAWYTRVHGNEPYTDPVAQDAIHSLLSKRSAYYLPTPTFHTPIFAAQGFTDEIFPARQAEQMYARLKSEDPSYPIRLYVGDWGHPRSEADDGETHYLANAVMKWLNHYVKGAGSTPASRIDARTAVCGDAIGDLYRADTWADLSSGSMPLTLAGPQDLSTSADDPHRATIDPVNSSVIDRSSCRTTNTAVATGNVATTSDALATPFTMLGYPTVEMTAVPSAADMYVAAHLWDVAADGTTQTLVDRGVFRLGAASSQLVRFNLNGNGWTFDTGHKIKLELTAVDSPTFKASAATGTVSISGVTATVPQAAASKLVQ
ncbi:MAG: type transport system ATP-binding protein, partial [Actinomycetota bacterium]|nr:type transport system ATP-binding protein [Actinomycetota bacterium]